MINNKKKATLFGKVALFFVIRRPNPSLLEYFLFPRLLPSHHRVLAVELVVAVDLGLVFRMDLVCLYLSYHFPLFFWIIYYLLDVDSRLFFIFILSAIFLQD